MDIANLVSCDDENGRAYSKYFADLPSAGEELLPPAARDSGSLPGRGQFNNLVLQKLCHSL